MGGYSDFSLNSYSNRWTPFSIVDDSMSLRFHTEIDQASTTRR